MISIDFLYFECVLLLLFLFLLVLLSSALSSIYVSIHLCVMCVCVCLCLSIRPFVGSVWSVFDMLQWLNIVISVPSKLTTIYCLIRSIQFRLIYHVELLLLLNQRKRNLLLSIVFIQWIKSPTALSIKLQNMRVEFPVANAETKQRVMIMKRREQR